MRVRAGGRRGETKGGEVKERKKGERGGGLGMRGFDADINGL